MEQLPGAPKHYNLHDEDEARQFLKQQIRDARRRLKDLEETPPVTPPPPGSSTMLRIGLAHGLSQVGLGPGRDTDPPRWSFMQELGITPTAINDAIQNAIDSDVLLMFAPSGGRGSQLDSTGQFSRTKYEANVRRYEGNTFLADAIDNKQVLLWAVDEANAPTYNDSCDPDDVNWMGNLHKEIWPGALVFIRMGTNSLVGGWNGQPKPAGGWTGIDYGWEQRSGQHNNETVSSFYSTRKAQLLAMNLGMIPGLNWWNGGIRAQDDGKLGGLSYCWDMQNTGSSSGFIVGTGNRGVYADMQRVNCTSPFSDTNKTVVQPDYFRHWANVVKLDTDAPFAMIWQWPEGGSLGVDEAAAIELELRPDFTRAFDDVITTLHSRTSWSGWRTAKPGDPI